MKAKALGVLLALVLLAGVAAWRGHVAFTSPGPAQAPITVIIPKGAGTEAAATLLEQAGVISDRFVFIVGTKLRRATLKAGEYAFPARVSAEDAMRIVADGRVVVHKLTVAEGLTVRQVAALVEEADFLSGSITRSLSEGWLLPETWHAVRDEPRDEVLARMEKSMRRNLETLWAGRDLGVALRSPEEALILASIVERETAIAAERPRIAAVFYNRMARGMRLQSDPTVIYGVSDGMGVLDRPLTRADLNTAHPWNTYAIDGLPRTPIANPGRASLEAVLHPIRTDDLYFVADGSGGHAFAATLDAHNANVTRWRQIERSRNAPAP
ncbi:endolytic transglycosylase MltG [Magnetospirillum molischianum]|uniref:Endolytic murein transglycosylase n=1 Tax=Magnetospirillum molischianum DSM 120 TaxID=1150626 RepID=H8FSI3_MAGML|nr:endolytic transglycosylase MltG [Magnetospirillum molischianum]CCG41321.1 Predicted periplasmic solute-binding protein [Magnetospirillum molischianum DSM 120]